MTKRPGIHILKDYTNAEHLKEQTYEQEHVSNVAYSKDGFKIELTESNSLVEDKYSLNIHSAKYVVEGSLNEIKEVMIHHHPKGHRWKHLQFKLKSSKNETIRINLEPLDNDDYIKCIKGFLYISQTIIIEEQKDNRIDDNLASYFFNEHIMSLSSEGKFLLSKIEYAYKNGAILDNANNSVERKEIESLKREKHLLPFLEWA